MKKNKKKMEEGYSEDSEDSEESEEELDIEDFDTSMNYRDVKGNIVYKIEKKYETDDFEYSEENEENMFGHVIDVYMESIGQTIPEYLVNFDFFVKVMKDNGFRPVVPTTVKRKYSTLFKKDNFNNSNIGSFKDILDKIPEIEKTDPEFNERYSPAREMKGGYSIKHPMYNLSSLNNYFVFQKRD